LGISTARTGPGKIRPRRHAVPQPVEVVCQPRLTLLDRHAVGPGRSTVTLHFQPRSPDQPLGDVMRLAGQHWLTHATPPFRLVPFISLDGPAPSLPNPLRYAGGSQLLQASPPARPRRYSAPRGFCRSGFSRTTPVTPAVVSGRAFARSKREPRSRSCCLYAGPHLGSKRVSPRLIPRLNGCLGFEVTYEPFDTSTAEGLTPIAHLLDPHLTRSFAAPFPTTLSTTVAN
jgi:hypothetical protein